MASIKVTFKLRRRIRKSARVEGRTACGKALNEAGMRESWLLRSVSTCCSFKSTGVQRRGMAKIHKSETLKRRQEINSILKRLSTQH